MVFVLFCVNFGFCLLWRGFSATWVLVCCYLFVWVACLGVCVAGGGFDCVGMLTRVCGFVMVGYGSGFECGVK